MTSSKQSIQSPAERRNAEADVRGLIARFSPRHSRLIAAARRSLRKRLPGACEIVYEYRDSFVISFSPSERGYEGVFALRGSSDGVKLYFNHGKGLPDPQKLLRGSANARWILLQRASTIAQPAVVRLIDEALARNPVPFPRNGSGKVIAKSTTAKKRG